MITFTQIFVIVSIVLIFLKLFKVINISWLWVFAPIWIPFCIVAGIGIVIGIISSFLY